MSSVRVVVTGMGMVTPIGNNVEEFTKNMFQVKSGAGRITRFDPAELPTKVACEVKSFETDYRDIKIAFALQAAKEAMTHSFGKNHKFENNERALLSLGIGLEVFSVQDLIDLKIKGKGSDVVDDLTFLNTPSDICAHLISKEYGLGHEPLIHISACAASTDAIGSAFLKIRRGQADLVLAGGTDSMINHMGVAGFCRIGAMTQKNDTPEFASAPFDSTRDGFLLGEGAGFLVLESEESAKNRGATIYAEISGYGNSLDAYSISDPHPEGVGAQKSMQRALESAGINANDISAINVHGTGTPKNDPAESNAIRTLFGDHYKNVPAFSTKSLIGHLISAAGAVETITSIQCILNSKIHPTRNLKDVDEGCELCHVKDEVKELELNHILKNSFGFGGQNGSLVISKWR